MLATTQIATAPVLPWLLSALAVAAASHGYLWLRLVRGPGLTARRARAATAVIVSLALLLPAGMAGLLYMRRLSRALAQPLMAVTFTYVGVLLFLLLMLAGLDLFTLLRPRVTSARGGAIVALASAAVISVYAMAQALRPLTVEAHALHLPSLPAALVGYRIAHLSDLHVGPTIGRAFVEALVRATNEAHPDLVVITGDLVDGTPAALAEALGPLRDLVARDGVYMVFGNHEYLSGAEAWRAFLPTLGIRVLRNERAHLPALDLVGIDDALPSLDGAPGADFARAFAGPARYTVALVHEPVEDVLAFRPALQLSGHTHGGQIFPLHVLAWLSHQQLSGASLHGATLVHVSPGAGYWGPPMRLGSRAEISLLVLGR